MKIHLGHECMIYALCFLGKDNQIATISLDNTVQIWDSDKGNIVKILEIPSKQKKYCDAIDENGVKISLVAETKLACRKNDRFVTWDFETNNISYIKEDMTDYRALKKQFPNDRILNDNGSYKCWDSDASVLAYWEDSKIIVYTEENNICIYRDYLSHVKIISLLGHKEKVLAVFPLRVVKN